MSYIFEENTCKLHTDSNPGPSFHKATVAAFPLAMKLCKLKLRKYICFKKKKHQFWKKPSFVDKTFWSQDEMVFQLCEIGVFCKHNAELWLKY